MTKIFRIVALGLVAYLVLAPMTPSLATAQEAQQSRQSAVSTADLDAALADRGAQDAADRDRLASLLSNAEVREIASTLGLDLTRAEAAVQTLDGEALASASAHADLLEETLAGGATIHLSLVALLLIVIIVILLAD